MRIFVVAMTVVLTATGLLLVFSGASGYAAGGGKWVSILHIWGGLVFLVVFPLYAWDHIRGNRRWLRKIALVSGSGAVQTLAAVLLILTGVVLYLYGLEAWPTARLLHHWGTYPLAAALAAHYLARKR